MSLKTIGELAPSRKPSLPSGGLGSVQRLAPPGSAAYNWLMSAALSKALVLATGLVIAFQAGWRCPAAFRPAVNVPAKVAHSCCCPEGMPTSDHKRLPVQPDQSCCCRADATIPPGSVTVSPDFTFSCQLCVANNPHQAHFGIGWELEAACLATSPSLHVLQCVWRC